MQKKGKKPALGTSFLHQWQKANTYTEPFAQSKGQHIACITFKLIHPKLRDRHCTAPFSEIPVNHQIWKVYVFNKIRGRCREEAVMWNSCCAHGYSHWSAEVSSRCKFRKHTQKAHLAAAAELFLSFSVALVPTERPRGVWNARLLPAKRRHGPARGQPMALSVHPGYLTPPCCPQKGSCWIPPYPETNTLSTCGSLRPDGCTRG